MRIERDMIPSSFVDRFEIFWISAAAAVSFDFCGCFKQILKLFWDYFLHGKIMVDTMVQTDSSFDENRKRYDPFFVCQWIWNFLNSKQLFDFQFLIMNGDCLKIKVTFDFTCKEVG
jgi:hypothetical protein